LLKDSPSYGKCDVLKEVKRWHGLLISTGFEYKTCFDDMGKDQTAPLYWGNIPTDRYLESV